MQINNSQFKKLESSFPKIYSVILTFNNYTDTYECVNSVLSNNFKVTGIVIVDNGSHDNSTKKLLSVFGNNSTIHFILNNQNLGFAAGVNVGIRYALKQGADYILLLNNDTIIDKNCISYLISEISKSSSFAIAGPRIFYYNNPNKIWHGGGYFSYLKAGIVIPEKNKLSTNFDETAKTVTFLTGCAMLIKNSIFDKIGFFDEDYFFYGEDLDFCMRALRNGYTLLYVPKAKVWHKIESIAKDRTNPFYIYHLARSKILFLRKNFSSLYFLYGLLIHFLLYTPFRLLQIISGSCTWNAVLAWFDGTLSGVFQSLQDVK
jgi:GT2 family glycosyltransferase